MQRITPFLWFDGRAGEAIAFYTSIFKHSVVRNVTRYGEGGPGPKGEIMTGTFELDGQAFMALNGGPHYTFTPAISLFVRCETQQEVDHYWDKLSEGGKEGRCGWLTDKFGVSWQIVPVILEELLHGGDGERSARAMQAMLRMGKLDIAALKAAYDGEGMA